MCGIIGYFAKGNQKPDRTVFEQAVDAMTHRGPDRRGIGMDGPVGLGFRRLAIIDLETGDQPMSNEDDTIRIVFNGEIYNFLHLREQLEAKGHHFKTHSDTETILHLYEEEGSRCVDHLRGMFAFAIHDSKKNSLFLARDRFGKKPLVYSETSSGFYFASEIPALLKLADCPKEVDPASLDACLSLNHVPTPQTIWSGIRRLPSAHTLEVRNGIAGSISRYWKLDWSVSEIEPFSEEEAIERFRKTFEESVKLRMMADVPIGAFLSGGIDSSVTVAAMTKLGARVQTFCIGFEDQRFDESDFASHVAHRLGTEHHELQVAPDSLEALDPLIDRFGEPFADQSLLPTFQLSRFTREKVTVALSGDGGDELFGGYKRYAHLNRAAFLQRWGIVRPWLAGSRCLFALEQWLNPDRRSLRWPRTAVDRIVGLQPLQQYMELVNGWDAASRKAFFKQSFSTDTATDYLKQALELHATLQGMTRWQALDMETWLGDDILRKVDFASMASSLECRCPLLDQHIVQLAAGLPEKFKVNRAGETKILLKKLYPRLLPANIFTRPKKGFSMPMGSWMRKQWKEPLHASIEGSWSKGMDRCFQRNVLRQLWNEHQEGKQDHGQRLWTWFVLYRWNERFHPTWNSFQDVLPPASMINAK